MMLGVSIMKKKLLMVTDVMALGGVEKVIVTTLNGIDYSKFDVTLFIMYRTEGEKNNIKKIPPQVKIKYLSENPIKGSYQKILFYFFMFFPAKIMNRLIINEKYDVIITTKDIFTYPISVNKCCKIMWVHGGLEYLEDETKSIVNKLKRRHKKFIYNRFDKAVFLTEKTKKIFYEKYGMENKCYVLNNPINSNEIIKLANKPVLDYEFNNEFTIVCNCRLSIEKGLNRLLSSCEKLIKEGYKFKVLIIGEGLERANLTRMVTNSPFLKEKVTFLGFKENPFQYIKKCSLYVSSSLTEGYSLSIAEAIILELPILSTSCNGPLEILNNGEYGLLVENNEEELYKGLKKLFSNPQLLEYYKTKSKERKDFFTYQKSIERLEEILTGE